MSRVNEVGDVDSGDCPVSVCCVHGLGFGSDVTIVVRLDGNNVIEGRAILKAAAHPLIEQVDTMDGAANRAAELAAK